jgi:hypothetical protein
VDSFSIWHWIIFLIFLPLIYAYYRYCKSYKLLLAAIDPKYDRMSPNLAYLLFIPIFNSIWQLVMLFSVKGSLRRLQADKSLVKNIDGGFYYGLAMVICQVLIVIPALSVVMWIASIILWILCWTKVVESRAIIIA